MKLMNFGFDSKVNNKTENVKKYYQKLINFEIKYYFRLFSLK
jgi:hypothetical protein